MLSAVSSVSSARARFPAVARTFRSARARQVALHTRASSAEQQKSEQKVQEQQQPQQKPPQQTPRYSREYARNPYARFSMSPDPWNELAQLMGLLGGDMGTGSSLGAGPIPHRDSVGRLPNNFDFNMNIIETKKGYEFTADLPGLSKDMVNVELDTDNDMLMISAERAERHEEEDEDKDSGFKFHVYERSYGKYQRQFRMPENSISDPGKLDVTLKNGVLTVKVPKKPDAIDKADKKNLKKIAIKG